MKEVAAKHLEELETVLKSCKDMKTVQELWAFRGASNEVLANLAYVKRRENETDHPEAKKFIKQLEAMEQKYFKDGMPYHFYELDNK